MLLEARFSGEADLYDLHDLLGLKSQEVDTGCDSDDRLSEGIEISISPGPARQGLRGVGRAGVA